VDPAGAVRADQHPEPQEQHQAGHAQARGEQRREHAAGEHRARDEDQLAVIHGRKAKRPLTRLVPVDRHGRRKLCGHAIDGRAQVGQLGRERMDGAVDLA
jgi:hypothetical protein